jgi:hypothetical protein
MIPELTRVAELLTHAIAATVTYCRTRPGRAGFAPSLRPLFWFLVGTLVADGIRWTIHAKVLRHAARPFVGLARASFHVDQAGIVGWNAGLVMVTILAFTPKARTSLRRVVLGTVVAWLSATCALAMAYPALRGELLGYAYGALQLVTTVVAIVVAARAWGTDAWFGVAPRAASILMAGEVATLLGPYLGQPFRHWGTANLISACAYIILAWELRRSRLAA